ncbi:MAG TPA: SDR family oxidoreductase [Microbacterium sp.]|nr:SDR family oxidoreductase [Microbacterium sp.]
MASTSSARLRWSIPLPDLTGQVAVVTGASDGVGFEIARALAGAGAEVVAPVRNRSKGEAAAERIRSEHLAARMTLLDLDLAALASVDALVARLSDEVRPIDVFVANAGIMLLRDPVRHLSADGHELHFQTNFLGHAALLRGVLPLLRAGRARVALQCSLAADHFGLAWDDLQVERRYSSMRAYASSKIALGLFGMELHRRSGDGAASEAAGIRVALCHPGVALTNIAPADVRARRDLQTRLGKAVLGRGPFGQSPAEAALPALYAVTSQDAAGGGFYGPSGPFHLGGPPKPQRIFRNIADPVAGRRLWAALDELLANPKAPPPRTTL